MAAKSASTSQISSGDALIVIEVECAAMATLNECYDLSGTWNASKLSWVNSHLEERLTSSYAC